MKDTDVYSIIQSALDTALSAAREHKLLHGRKVAEDMQDIFTEYMRDHHNFCPDCEQWFNHFDLKCPDQHNTLCSRCQQSRRDAEADAAIVKRDYDNRG